ncbi:MAG: hypothetical protein A2283_12210 [Lentisphaerae bacterium RIFOXYA12_FULL_48_11]|nr:MAG: hypothetical protein A2283_12210 [Lentisphaerae bacterium RIFOXYA12_FULL_48_11]
MYRESILVKMRTKYKLLILFLVVMSGIMIGVIGVVLDDCRVQYSGLVLAMAGLICFAYVKIMRWSRRLRDESNHEAAFAGGVSDKARETSEGIHCMPWTNAILRVDKLRILIAADEKGIYKLYQLTFSTELAQNRIDVAVNGVEAVESFRTVHHGVIIMDVHMRKRNGIQTFKEIQAICEKEGLEMPFVVFCAHCPVSTELSQIAFDNSRCRIIHKPVSSELLIETLKVGLS